PFTRVTGLEVSDGRVRAVQTDRGRVAADRVVIAAGAWSPMVARLAGVELPNVPYRHEIVSSEPLKPFLGPLVSMLGTGLYFSQSMGGAQDEIFERYNVRRFAEGRLIKETFIIG